MSFSCNLHTPSAIKAHGLYKNQDNASDHYGRTSGLLPYVALYDCVTCQTCVTVQAVVRAHVSLDVEEARSTVRGL
jgi:hypothetical protein